MREGGAERAADGAEALRLVEDHTGCIEIREVIAQRVALWQLRLDIRQRRRHLVCIQVRHELLGLPQPLPGADVLVGVKLIDEVGQILTVSKGRDSKF